MDIVKLIIVIFAVALSIISATRKKAKPAPVKRRPVVFVQEFHEDNNTPVHDSCEEGSRAVAIPDDDIEVAKTGYEHEQEDEAHIEQWRQAVINAEILKTKF